MWIDTDKGHRLPAFHIKKGHKLTILVSHANAEDLGIVLGFWSYMSDALQVDVFAYEYSGYGHSTGTPSEENMYSDARAALQLLVDGFKLKPERDIVLYGKSIGSCPTSHLASRGRFRGVIIVSGLASGSRVLFPTTKGARAPRRVCRACLSLARPRATGWPRTLPVLWRPLSHHSSARTSAPCPRRQSP